MNKDEIRSLRKSLGLNRSEFGKMIGISASQVEKYELGTSLPSTAVLMHLTRVKRLNRGR